MNSQNIYFFQQIFKCHWQWFTLCQAKGLWQGYNSELLAIRMWQLEQQPSLTWKHFASYRDNLCYLQVWWDNKIMAFINSHRGVESNCMCWFCRTLTRNAAFLIILKGKGQYSLVNKSSTALARARWGPHRGPSLGDVLLKAPPHTKPTFFSWPFLPLFIISSTAGFILDFS